MKYFMNDEIYYQGKKQPPRKEYILTKDLTPDKDGMIRVLCEDGNYYTLRPEDIFEDK